MRKRIADEPADAGTETKSIADDDPENADDTCCYKRFDHGGDDIFSMHHAAIEKCKTGCHEKDKSRGHDQPGNVGGIVFTIANEIWERGYKDGDDRKRRQDQKRGCGGSG